MTIRLYESNGYKTSTASGIGANSLVLDGSYFVKQTAGIVDKATTGTIIVWVNETETTFASDNQTVAKKEVVFVPATADRLYEVEITWGTITKADEGMYYDLTDADTVNWTTGSAIKSVVNTSDAGATTDPVLTKQVQLVKFLTATKSIFRIVV